MSNLPIASNTIVKGAIVDPKTGIPTDQGRKWLGAVTQAANAVQSSTFAGETSQTAIAGPAAALPATPSGYMIWMVDGQQVKVPFYGV